MLDCFKKFQRNSYIAIFKCINFRLVFCSSHVLFSISQKLTQHQIINFAEILKWLREILICRNNFLIGQRECNAYVGSNIPICKQAHIKLEVCCVLLAICLLSELIYSLLWLVISFVKPG